MFKPIQFTYHPPETIPPAPAEMRPVESQISGTEQGKTRARDLMDQLDILDATSTYLQEAILAVHGGTVIQVDPTRKPEVALALSRIYGEAPAGISAAMYSNLLDTQMSMTRAEIQMKGVDTGLKINPVQKADIQTVINEYETQAVESGEFAANTTVLLNQLKGDKVIFEQLREGLGEYEAEKARVSDADTKRKAKDTNTDTPPPPPAPADTVAPPDVSEDIHREVKQRLDGWQTYYSVTHSLIRDVDSVYSDLVQITEKYFYQPVDLLLKLVAALSSLKSLFHKPNLQDIRASMVWMVYPRLISEASKYTFLLDRLVQRAVDPVFQLLGSVDRLFAQICSVASDAAYLIGKGNFSGLRQEIGYQWQNPGKRRNPKDRERIKELDKLSRGFASMQGHIAKSVQQARSKRERTKRSMMKLLDRRLVGTSDRLETLESLRSAESIISILRSMAQEAQRISPNTRAGRFLDQPLGPLGQALGTVQDNNGSVANIMNGIEQGANLSITVQGNTTRAERRRKPPEPPPAVAQALEDHLPERSSDNGEEEADTENS